MTEYKKVVPFNKSASYKKLNSNNDRKWAATSSNALSYVNVGEREMYDDFIRRPEFEEHKKHLDYRFDTLEGKISSFSSNLDKQSENLAKNIELKIDNNLKNLKIELNEQAKITRRWFVGTIVAIVGAIVAITGLAGRLFGLY
ncbi:hypothetical protein [Macrococcoides canis]|uniref:hypothetical protein n=1 Tax=Macrococcoides canis TaxID=1855823 RepID=UPI00105CFC77|nr:hypothetical protein [Macrococcus canis]TDM24305.1 hypothetical protein ETI02_00485 [Macrococcus canis]